MLKQLGLGLMVLVGANVAMAAELTAADAGVYELVTLKNNEPVGLSGIQMRFQHQNGQWLMEGKDGSLQGAAKNQWQAVCTPATNCRFSPSSTRQLKAMFPQWTQMSQTDDIGCIQNDVQAFCRFDSKTQKGYTSYMIVALQAQPPVQMILQRQQ